MAFPASEPMRLAGVVLGDEDGVRWRFVERLDWLNAGLAEVLALKPSALAESRILDLIQGTRQTIPANASVLVRAIRNVTIGSNQARIGGRAIGTANRVDMDAMAPDWHDATLHPSSTTVKTVISDSEEPRAYYVYPPNSGQGHIEALVASPHPPLQRPTQSGSLGAYGAVSIGLSAEYLPAMTDYILHRCFQKEGEFASSAARAQQHYLAFANTLGVKLANERAHHVSRTYQERSPAQ